ncbi:MAG: hypothetical protein V1859_03230 [archaeon]
MWDRFGHNKGQTNNIQYYQCGSVHYAPNSLSDYDWSSYDNVLSNCDDWYNYPNFMNTNKMINCTDWNCDAREHKIWWLSHLPRAPGTEEAISNNWWDYIVITS